jgi:curved DNA-binding protein CbpA
MNVDKDYYFILGTLQTAEDTVIRAAYKALSQKYHPDKNQERKEFADEKMSDINEAYSILSNTIKRKQYDEYREAYVSDFDGYSKESNDFDKGEYDPCEEGWKLAAKYQPDLLVYERELSKFSKKLAFTYKAFLLTSKLFDQSKSIAELIENQFLAIYFGDNPEIIKFARGLIMRGEREAARELNKVIKIFGNSADARKVISQISNEYKSDRSIESVCPMCMQLNRLTAKSCRRCDFFFSSSWDR